MPSLTWRHYTDRLEEITDLRAYATAGMPEQTRIRRMASKHWGLHGAGYHLVSPTPPIFVDVVSDTPWPQISTWARMETHSSLEAPNDNRARPDYSVHVALVDPHWNPYRATITLGVERVGIQRRAPGAYSPLIDPVLGVTTNNPTAHTRSGEALWSVRTTTRREFLDALADAHGWLTDRERCEALTALTPRHPNQ